MLSAKYACKSGGTRQFELNELPQWQTEVCTKCTMLFKKHYYMHQCIRIPHRLCYNCLVCKGRCLVCFRLFTKMWKAESTSRDFYVQTAKKEPLQ